MKISGQRIKQDSLILMNLHLVINQDDLVINQDCLFNLKYSYLKRIVRYSTRVYDGCPLFREVEELHHLKVLCSTRFS